MKRVLDLGCGAGRHTVYLAQEGFEVYTLDISLEGVEHIAQWLTGEGLQANLQQADMTALQNIMQTYMLKNIQELINTLPRKKGAAIVLDDNSERIYTLQIRPRISWHAGGSPSAIEKKGIFD